MMRTPLMRWLVASRAMRSSYGAVKALAFMTLALAVGLRTGAMPWVGVWTAGLVMAWLATALCLVRGLPVLLDAGHLFRTSS